MRARPPRLLVTALRLALAAALALPLAAAAEKADREKEIQVLADRLAADDSKKEAVYEGNVIITQGTMRITSSRIVVREDPEGYRTEITIFICNLGSICSCQFVIIPGQNYIHFSFLLPESVNF